MYMENPYLWSTDQLLNEFMNACGHAGFSNSSMVISFSAGNDLSRAHYLRGIILARIDRVTPPFNPGEMVGPKDKTTSPKGNGYKRSSNPRALPKMLTVREIQYTGGNSWLVEFQEINDQTADTDGEYDMDGARSWHVPLSFNASDFVSLATAEVR